MRGYLVSIGWILALSLGCQSQTDSPSRPISGGETLSYNDVVVEAACGECMFAMPGTGCHLAVRIEGKPYFVDGAGIDDFGDAHGEQGLCNAVRRARVSGRLENDRFVASDFRLLPLERD